MKLTKAVIAVLILCTYTPAQKNDGLAKAQITPEALVQIMRSNSKNKPLILNVGPRVLHMQAHIEGAEFIGPASTQSGIERLRERVKDVPKNREIVVYCGCCPWGKCPNVRPAFSELEKLGFTNVKVLYIANNIGTDWVDKGYPVARGQ